MALSAKGLAYFYHHNLLKYSSNWYAIYYNGATFVWNFEEDETLAWTLYNSYPGNFGKALIHKRKVITLTGDKKYAFACIGYFSQ
jgi:hypothetical protein